MPASPLPRPSRSLTESDIDDPAQCMTKHLAELDARLADQAARGDAQIARANGAVARLKTNNIAGSTRFSLKQFVPDAEPCWEASASEDSQTISPCPHDPVCLEFEKARRGLGNGGSNGGSNGTSET